ncbi:MAG: RNA pseudouridine synthase [Spirochaetes bacterium]|nr:RNA pseudouridine synthase [Spirochaetota bacterium]
MSTANQNHASGQKSSCFRHLHFDKNQISLPIRFTYPFNYDPHPLCVLAATEVQKYLNENSTAIGHDFGLDGNLSADAIGKMFGVLIVRNREEEIGFISAYSGKLGGRNTHSFFVPPIIDLLNEKGFFRKGETELNLINHQIEVLENDREYLSSLEDFIKAKQNHEIFLKKARQNFKHGRMTRKACRKKAAAELSEDDFNSLLENHKKESNREQSEIKMLVCKYKEEAAELKSKLDFYQKQIDELKEKRKIKSGALQKRIFKSFSFLNSRGERKNLKEIFEDTVRKVPPAGAGECAAPRLLQYAYENGLDPVAMAEFWYGCAPPSEIRRHGSFYPPCRSKCEPILRHMLQGLNVETDPMVHSVPEKQLEIIYEDEAVAVVNKPEGLLSVPGKKVKDSVLTRISKLYPENNSPFIVHRLDLSTSGVMIIAKTKEAHKILQKEFKDRKVVKRYVALVEGNIEGNEGFIDLPLRVDLDNRPRQMVCFSYGKPSKTKWKVLKRNEKFCRLHFFPLTGRTHQLRVHSAHKQGLDSPIKGDDLYGTREYRLYLHADYIRFYHPVSGKKMGFYIPPDF